MSTPVTDEQVTRAVAVWDQARCRVNELWHGGKCEPCSDVHRKNVEPMFRQVLEDFVSSLSTADAPSPSSSNTPNRGISGGISGGISPAPKAPSKLVEAYARLKAVIDRNIGFPECVEASHAFSLEAYEAMPTLLANSAADVPSPAPDAAGLPLRAREPAIAVAASLAAAISLLERGSKKAAPSDKMFDQMLDDYRKSLDAFREAYAAPDAAPVNPVAGV